MPRQKLATEIRQEQIAQATLQIVAEQGFSQLNVAAVAKRVGIVPSAIYRHFRGKDELLDAVLGLVEQRLRKIVDEAMVQTDEVWEQLHAVLLAHLQMIESNRALPRLIFSEAIYGSDDRRRQRVRTIIDTYLRRIAQLIRTGQRQGHIRHEVKPQAAAVLFLGLIQPLAILWQLSDGQLDITKQARQSWTIFRRGLQTTSPGEQS